jgi:hypothetical protein
VNYFVYFPAIRQYIYIIGVAVTYFISFLPTTGIDEETTNNFGDFLTTTAYLVKKLGVMSIAKFGSIIGMILGIILGLKNAINIVPTASIAGGSMVLGVGSGVMTFVMNVFMGIIFGFIGGAIIAFIYNFALGEIGGIEVDLEVKE